MVNKYEALYIINAQLDEEAIKGLVEKFKSLLDANGTVDSIDEWGRRRLAYEINDMNEGYYVLAVFNVDSSFPQELERIFKITDGVIKYMIIKKD